MADANLIDANTTTLLKRQRLTLPVWLVSICIIAFTVLLISGAVIWKNAPPVPEVIRSERSQIVLTQPEIKAGQATYLSRGGQHIGSVWGHGSYLAPDWTADVLHRWGLATAGVLYDGQPDFSQADLEALPATERASLQAKVNQEFKTNRYDPETHELILTNAQTQGLTKVFEYYHELLAHGSVVHSIPDGWFEDDRQIHDVTAFFAWTAWAASANRPNAPFSYTANWPHDDLIGNQAPGQFIIWSIVSVMVLIVGTGVFLFIYLTQEEADEVQPVPALPAVRIPTPSQKVSSLFFGVAMTLFLVQIGMGMVTAHYYSQGLNTTPIHAHAALFGVYGCLALALMLFALREFVQKMFGMKSGCVLVSGRLMVVWQ